MSIRAAIVGVALVLVGCDAKNENSCLDGTCSDPARPYCDTDGFFSGTEGLCIQVACTANEFERCIGAEAQVCNDDGTNYRSVECPNGCGPTGCIGNPGCTTNAQCNNPNPVCDTSNKTCRMCTRNEECSSTLCEQGSCIAESSVVYASPGGAASGNCAQATPCTLTRATTIASSAANGILRLLPGTYTDSLVVSNSTTLTVYGKGATLVGGTGLLSVKAGDVIVRDVVVQSTPVTAEGIQCGATSNTPPLPKCTFRDVMNTGAIAVYNGEAHFYGYRHLNGAVRVDDDGSLLMDRAFLDCPACTSGPADFVATRQRLRVYVTNSVLVNFWPQFNTMDLATTNQVKFAYSTLVVTQGSAGIGPFVCGNSASYAQVGQLENNIIVAPSGIDAVVGSRCTTTNNVLFPQSTARPGNIIADPQFENQAAKDFRPRTTSPARNAAMPGTVTTDHDYTGAMRPQGGGADIGAYEIP